MMTISIKASQINDREDRDISADSNQIPERLARPPYKAAKTAEPAARRARLPGSNIFSNNKVSSNRESRDEPRSTKSKLTYASLFQHDQHDILS